MNNKLFARRSDDIIEGMRVLGIDPGLGTIGFGLIQFNDHTADATKQSPEWGAITTTKNTPDGGRLIEIERDLTQVIVQLQPDVVSLERIFYFRNATTMVPVCQARGVIVLVLSKFNLPIYEYTPMQVKQAITGYGKAQKKEIQETLMECLSLSEKPRPDDAADGLALAYCHYLHVGRLEQMTGKTLHS